MPRKSSFIIIIQNYPLQINVRFPKGFYETVEVDAKYLRNVFSAYGKIDTCEVYNRIEYAPFARMTFFDIDGPFRAYLAGRQRKIQIGSHFLIVTMVEQNSTFIDELNNECLIAIFEKLNAKEKMIIEQVCRRFKDVGPKSWNNIKVLNGYDFHPSSVVFQKYLTRSAPYLRTLRMFSSARALDVVFQKCRNIVEFDITIRDVLHYKKIPRLKEIFPMAVTYEKYERRQIERIHYLCRIIENLPHLKRIRICGENSALFTAEPGIFASLPDTIEEVRIVSKGVHTALDNQEPIIVSQNVSRFSQMKLLELRGFRVYNSFEGWEGLHGLEHLNISKTTLDRRILDTIAKFTKLLTLNVAHAKVSDRLLDLFITNNQSLEEIDIEGLRFITHDTFLLISQLPHLRSLKLSHILCGTLYEMSPMPNLEFLACWGLDDINYALSEIVKQSKLLRYLNPQYYNLSTHFIQDVIKAARARRHGDILYLRIDRSALPRLNLPDEGRWPTLFRVGYCHFKNLDDYNRRGWAGVVSCRDLFTRYADNRYL